MSDIRRIKVVSKLQAKADAAREEGDMNTLTACIEQARRLAPRGSANLVMDSGNRTINTQHYGAHKLLQETPVGRVVKTTYEGKKGETMHGTYVRKGYRPNVSRKWLPAEARL